MPGNASFPAPLLSFPPGKSLQTPVNAAQIPLRNPSKRPEDPRRRDLTVHSMAPIVCTSSQSVQRPPQEALFRRRKGRGIPRIEGLRRRTRRRDRGPEVLPRYGPSSLTIDGPSRGNGGGPFPPAFLTPSLRPATVEHGAKLE